MNLYLPVTFNFMFKNGDIIYNERYGVGEVICAAPYTSRIVLDIADENIPPDKTITVKNKEIRLLDDVIKIGDMVKSKEFGFGTVLNILRLDITSCLIKFDEPHTHLLTIEPENDNDRKNKMWCIPKYDHYNGFEPVEIQDIIIPSISAAIILRDMYQNACKDLPGREKEFLDNVKKEYINSLGKRIEAETKHWAKKYGYFLKK